MWNPRFFEQYACSTNLFCYSGALDEGALREFIMSNAFQIEVHDRDLLDNEDTG